MSKRKQKARKNAKQRSEETNVHEALLYLEETFDVCGDDMSRDRVLSANIYAFNRQTNQPTAVTAIQAMRKTPIPTG